MKKKQVEASFEHIAHLQKLSSSAVADWKKRFDAKNGQAAKTTT